MGTIIAQTSKRIPSWGMFSAARTRLTQEVSICSKVRVRFIQTQVWRTQGNFPERSLERVKNKEDIGLAFSGGGTRSAAATLGQLAALSEIGLLDRVKYISAVSGGGWAATPYTFLPANIPDQEFFGHFVEDPAALTMQKLDTLAHTSFARAISETVIIDDFFWHALRWSGDETYARALGSLFLKPFGLDKLNHSFTYDQETLALADKSVQYYTTKDNRPFLILGSVLLTEKFGKVPVEMTAQYTGVRGYFEKEETSVGGSYVSSYGYDSESPQEAFPRDSSEMTTDVKLSSKRNFFTLSDMIGTTGAAPQEILNKLGLSFLGFPEFHYWGLQQDQTSFTPSREIPQGDGAFLENLGVMPLFARQVQKITVFVNTMEPLEYHHTHEEQSGVARSLRPLFEPVRNREHEGLFAKNVVLEGGREKYKELVRALYQKKVQGESLIHTDTYGIKKNTFYGVEQPYNAQITWVYNERVKSWEDQLPAVVRSRIGHGDFDRFPHYRTFFENPLKIIDLSRRQVSLLSHLSYWNVKCNQRAILKE